MNLHLVVKYVDGEPISHLNAGKGRTSQRNTRHRVFQRKKDAHNYAARVAGEVVRISSPDRKGGIGLFPHLRGELAIAWDEP